MQSWDGSKGAIGAIVPPKIYEGNFIHHNFVQFGKQHSWCQATSSSIVFVTAVLWNILHLSYSSVAVMRLDCQILLKSSPPLTLLVGSALGEKKYNDSKIDFREIELWQLILRSNIISAKTTELNPFANSFNKKSISRDTTHPQSWDFIPSVTRNRFPIKRICERSLCVQATLFLLVNLEQWSRLIFTAHLRAFVNANKLHKLWRRKCYHQSDIVLENTCRITCRTSFVKRHLSKNTEPVHHLEN